MSEHVMRIALIGTILEAGKADDVARICGEYGAFYHISLPVKGMARSELLDVLGLGEKNWALTLSLVPQPLVHYLRRTLRDALMLVQPNMGILFTVPLSGINARAATAISKGTNSEYLEESMVYERGEKPMAELPPNNGANRGRTRQKPHWLQPHLPPRQEKSPLPPGDK